jgi:hypothetical protein
VLYEATIIPLAERLSLPQTAKENAAFIPALSIEVAIVCGNNLIFQFGEMMGKSYFGIAAKNISLILSRAHEAFFPISDHACRSSAGAR